MALAKVTTTMNKNVMGPAHAKVLGSFNRN